MAYIGRTPQSGNFQVCDTIAVVNDQAAYTMQVSSVDVIPETANHMLVSLNGILQAPTSSYTVSGSTITFASNLITGDVINFIQILGSVLDLGVPSDDTVSLAKLTATGTKDSTTFLRGDNTFAVAGGTNTPAFEAYPSGTQTISADSWTKLNFATERFDTDGKYDASTSTFTPTVSGKYYIYAIMDVTPSGNGDQIGLRIYKNGSLVTQNILGLTSQYIKSGNNNAWFAYSTQISDADDYFEIYGYFSDNAAVVQTTGTLFGAYKIIE